MKKLVSLTLAVAMVLSLFAISTNAAVPVKVVDETFGFEQDYEGSVEYFSTGCYKAGEIILDGDGTVASLEGRSQIEAAVEGFRDASNYTFEFDVKAPFASTDLRLHFKNNLGSYGVVLRPGLFVPLTKQLRSDFATDSAIYKGMWTNSATVESEEELVSDQWYNFIITVDNASLNKGLTADTVLQNIEVQYKKAEDTEYTVVPGNKSYAPWEASWYPIISEACSKQACNMCFCNFADNGQQYSVWMFDTEADTITKLGSRGHYLIDNIKLDASIIGEDYETKGVIFHEDYENGSNKLNFGSFSKTVTDDEGNTYLEIDIPTRVSGVEGVKQYMESSTITAESLPEGFIWTFDICALDDNTVDFKLEYFSDSFGATRTREVNGETITEPVAKVHGDFAVSKSLLTTNEWYKVKLVRFPGVEKPVATFTNLETGRVIKNYTVNREGNLSDINSYNRFFIRSALYNDTRVFKWAIDNFTITELGAGSMVYAEKDGENVSVSINVDAAVDLKATGITVTPILALYKEDRLVAVNSDSTAINDYDGTEVRLNASGDYDKAVIMLWKSVGDEPIVDVWDITDQIVDVNAVSAE